MSQKHKGGRGQRAENPYERLSVTLPPDLKLYLDAQAEAQGLNRSEMVAFLLEDHQARNNPKPLKASKNLQVVEPSRTSAGPSTALTAPRKPKHQDAEVLQVVSVEIPRHIRGQLRWDKEKYQQAEERLAQGKTLSRIPGKADWVTEKGEVMSWRTVQALSAVGLVSNGRVKE